MITSLSLKSSLTFFTLWIKQTFPLRMFFPFLAEHRRSLTRHEPQSFTIRRRNQATRLLLHTSVFVHACTWLSLQSFGRTYFLKSCFWLSPSESFPISLAWRGRTQLFYFTAQRLQFQYSPGGTQCTIFSHMLTRCDARSTCSTRPHSTRLARTILSSMRFRLPVLL